MPCSRGCCVSPAEHFRSVSFATSPVTKVVDRKEAQWAKDMPAYARLRKDGLQPKGIDGAAHVEQGATEPVEVEMGRVYEKPSDQARLREGMEMSRELGVAS